jgi:hypothetical protein
MLILWHQRPVIPGFVVSVRGKQQLLDAIPGSYSGGLAEDGVVEVDSASKSVMKLQ